MRPFPLVASIALVVLCLTTPAGFAQTPGEPGLDVRIREAELASDGTTQLVVSVTSPDGAVGPLHSGAFQVTDGGRVVEDLTAAPVADTGVGSGTAMLVIDVSGSTGGGVLDAATAAATNLVKDVTANGVRVGLVTFNGRVTVLAEPTSDATTLVAALAGLEPGGGTALYDGVATAAALFDDAAGTRDVVVFSDGADSKSSTAAGHAAAAARDAEAAVTTVALRTDELDPAVLEFLAVETGGRVLAADDVTDLAGEFSAITNDLTSRYVLSYTQGPTGDGETDIAVVAAAAGMTGRDEVVTVDHRARVDALPLAGPARDGLMGLLARPAALYAGAGLAAFAVLVLLGALVVVPGESRGSRVLRRSLTITTGERKPEADEGGSALAQAAAMMERLPLNEKREEEMQQRLARAGWPLRSSEFRVLQVAGAIGALGIGYVLFGQPVLAVLLGAVGAIAPTVLLNYKIGKRARTFEAQLPDILQLLAGSLRAGYGLLQAVDTVAEEADEPAAGELSRVLTEARLGGSVEAALEDMAERIGSEDFRWVVMAINIQRQVGGNLAALLETVARTIRGREELRREVKTLSAEGKLSAIILVSLPFFIAGYTAFVNPSYLQVLTGSTGGRIAMAFAACLMGLGILWIRKIIRIKV